MHVWIDECSTVGHSAGVPKSTCSQPAGVGKLICQPLCRGPEINLQSICSQPARLEKLICRPPCKWATIRLPKQIYMSAPMNYFAFDVLNQSMDICQNAQIKNLYVTICATCGPYSTEFATMQTTMQTPITTTVNILIFQPLQVGCGLILGPLQNAKHQSCRT